MSFKKRPDKAAKPTINCISHATRVLALQIPQGGICSSMLTESYLRCPSQRYMNLSIKAAPIVRAPDIAAKAYLRSARSAHKARCANRSARERRFEFPIRATPKLAALVENTKSTSTGMICLYRFLSPKFYKPRPVNLDSLPWRTTERLFAHALSGWSQPADAHIARGRPASRLAPRPRHSARRVRP
jgi:hypothetical protein